MVGRLGVMVDIEEIWESLELGEEENKPIEVNSSELKR